MAIPFNLALDEFLVGLGYVRTRQEAEWEDVGNAETGPMVEGSPAYDEYCGADEYVFASESGLVDRMPRDLDFEVFVAGQQAQCGVDLDVLEAERHTRESLEVALDRAIGDGDVDAIVELRRAQRILDGGVDIAAKSQAAWDAQPDKSAT